ncbi:hypothetical protein TNIN_148021 [Trichonephila inaurata madagascariensis]|uniref:Uncharacterized protein n=1 Tax=Trichonephila inaurata madagascariensis TaxID=2747483 RepID=A0A8X6XL23_9ARAC|nr:hypothetical protein TNIN_148021 [Trichonephila inaurata madagascariensis]
MAFEGLEYEPDRFFNSNDLMQSSGSHDGDTKFVLGGSSNDYSPFTPEVEQYIERIMYDNKEHIAQLYGISFDQGKVTRVQHNQCCLSLRREFLQYYCTVTSFLVYCFILATFAARSFKNGTKKAPFDAIGYITSFLRISRRNGRVSDDFWQQLQSFCE